MSGITKRFGSNVVLHDVSLDVYPGEVHILAGENGAGKSTLIKVLAGVYPDWAGNIEYFGRTLRPRSPLEAMRLGVSIIYQELSLVPSMTVSDNIFLGRHAGRAGFVPGGAAEQDPRTDRERRPAYRPGYPRGRTGDRRAATVTLIFLGSAAVCWILLARHRWGRYLCSRRKTSTRAAKRCNSARHP